MGRRGTRTCPRRPLASLLSAPTFCIGNAFLLIVILDSDSPKSRGKGPSATLSPGFRILRRINPQVQRAQMTPAVLSLWAPTKCAFSGSEDAQELALWERECRPAAGIGGQREARRCVQPAGAAEMWRRDWTKINATVPLPGGLI